MAAPAYPNPPIPTELARHMPSQLAPDATLHALAEARLARAAHERPWAVADLRSNVKTLLRYLGELPIVALTMALFVGLVRLLQELRLAAATIRKVLATARALLEDARVAGLIDRNPAHLPRGLLPPRKIRDEMEAAADIFTHREIARLLLDERLPLERRAFYALLLLTGMRFGEAAALMWCDLDMRQRPMPDLTITRSWTSKCRLVRPTTKSGVARHVPCSPLLLRMLELAHADFRSTYGRDPGGLELVSPRRTKEGEPAFRLETIALRQWYRDLDLLGIRRRPLHRCRATFDTTLRRAGADGRVVRRFTHPPKASDPFHDLYDLHDWPERCAAMALYPDLTKETDR